MELTIFDEIERKGQHRRHHNKVGHKRGDYTAYWHFLMQYKLNQINGKKEPITHLQKQFNIGRFKLDLMPDDIDTIAIDGISYEYAYKWFKEKLDPYFKAGRIKSKNKKLANATPQPVADAAPSLADVLEDIYKLTTDFIAKITNQITDIQNIINSKNLSL